MANQEDEDDEEFLKKIVSKYDKKNKGKDIMSKVKKEEFIPRKTLSEDEISSPGYYLEDLNAYDKELVESRNLYNELHVLFEDVTKDEFNRNRRIKDIADLTKSLVSARSATADIVSKRLAAKKTVADIMFRNKSGEDLEEGSVALATARKVVSILSSDNPKAAAEALRARQEREKDSRTSEGKRKRKQEEDLDSIIDRKIKKGELPMYKNDKLVGIQEHAVIRYDDKHEKYVAVDTRNGKVIKDFPEERLPKAKVSRRTEDGIITQEGKHVPLLSDMEFDDYYEDNDA